MPKWTPEYERASFAEGWVVSDCSLADGGQEMQLQRLDCPENARGEVLEPIFPDDGNAWAHVVRRALEGSPMHLCGLEQVSAAELQRIREHCGPLPDELKVSVSV